MRLAEALESFAGELGAAVVLYRSVRRAGRPSAAAGFMGGMKPYSAAGVKFAGPTLDMRS